MMRIRKAYNTAGSLFTSKNEKRDLLDDVYVLLHYRTENGKLIYDQSYQILSKE
jgi:hypothetical protein